jgi:hypothetical protein
LCALFRPPSNPVASVARNTDLIMGSSKEKAKAVTKNMAKRSKPLPATKSKPKPDKAVAKKATPDKKKKKKRERMDAAPGSDDEDEAEVVGGEEGEEQAEHVEAVSDDEDNVADKKRRASKPDARTEKEKEADRKLKSARRNAKAKRRGFRTIAKRSGYSASRKRAGGDGSLDVAVPVTTTSEAIRACKWAPTQDGKAAFEGLTEFDERVQLSLESLPKSAARVFQAHGEQYLRRLASQTVQMASDQLKTRATASMVASVTRPLKRVQKYSFVAPKGVVRFSQKDAKGVRLGYADGEQAALDSDKVLHGMQKKLREQLEAKSKCEKNPLLTAKDGGQDVKKAHKAICDKLAKIREDAAREQLA